MENNRIAIIGRIADGKTLYDGQTVLTNMIKNELKSRLPNYKIISVDTYNYRGHVVRCLYNTLKSVFLCDRVIVLLSKNGRAFYFKLLFYMNKIFHKKVYHRLIGGALDEQIRESPKMLKYLNALEINWVETKSLQKKLNNLGLKNTAVSPNFKSLPIVKKEELPNYTAPPYRFCTFCRVTKQKGISLAIEAIKSVNYEKEKPVVFLDIYGPIDIKYKVEFRELITGVPYIRYMGLVPPEKSVDVLKDYFMHLFPTTWKGEGFPGTLIDAFSSGLPTIATNWNYNAEILSEGRTGFCYNWQKPEKLTELIKYCISNPDNIAKMRLFCLEEAKKYQADIVMREIVEFMGCDA